MSRLTTLNLLPYQAAIVTDDPEAKKIVVHGRRMGATVAAAARAIERETHNPQGTLYMTPTRGSADYFQACCEQWIHVTGARARVMPVRPDSQCKVVKGLISIMVVSDGDRVVQALRGQRIPRIIIDSAAYVKRLKAIYSAIMMTPDLLLLSDWAEETFERDNDFNDLARRLKARRLASVHIIDLDTALKGGLYREFCRVRGEAYSQEREWDWRAEQVHNHGDEGYRTLFCGLPQPLPDGKMSPDQWSLSRAARFNQQSGRPPTPIYTGDTSNW